MVYLPKNKPSLIRFELQVAKRIIDQNKPDLAS